MVKKPVAFSCPNSEVLRNRFCVIIGKYSEGLFWMVLCVVFGFAYTYSIFFQSILLEESNRIKIFLSCAVS